MFAVPGWSLSSSQVKTHAEPTSARKVKNLVTPDNVAELWRQRIEKRTSESNGAYATAMPAEPPSKRKRKRKARGDRKEVATSQVKATQSLRLDNFLLEDLEITKLQDVAQSSQKRKVEKRTLSNTTVSPQAQRASVAPSMIPQNAMLTTMQSRMQQKLASARFRHLNETLYTTVSTQALELFNTNENMFEEYHAGFRQQVSSWPQNPVASFVHDLKTRSSTRSPFKGRSSQGKPSKGHRIEAANNAKPLPRTSGCCTIADLGCGDANLARQVIEFGGKFKIKVLSYDLYSSNELVTKADIAKLPLPDGTVDLAIFCLALMGSNWIEFIEEAWRVLRWKGELWVAEIKSRFDQHRETQREQSAITKMKKRKLLSNSAGKMDGEVDGVDAAEQLRVEVDGDEQARHGTDLSAFLAVLRRRGFVLQDESAIDLSNKMFVRVKLAKLLSPTKGKNVPKATEHLKKAAGGAGRKRSSIEEEVTEGEEADVLKPCLYKHR